MNVERLAISDVKLVTPPKFGLVHERVNRLSLGISESDHGPALRPILVIGGSSELGRALAALAGNRPVVLVDRPEFDFAVPDTIGAVLAATRPWVVVNVAEWNGLDSAQLNPEATSIANVEGPAALAALCAKARIRLIHLSTSFVFDGKKNSPYYETDPTEPENLYGATKLAGERAILNLYPGATVLRTSWIYGPHRRNFVHTILEAANRSRRIKANSNQKLCPTYATDLALAILHVIDRFRVSWTTNFSGIFHVANAGWATWYDLATSALDEIFPFKAGMHVVDAVGTADWPTRTRRPLDLRLDCSKFERVFQYRLPDWRDGLSRFIGTDLCAGRRLNSTSRGVKSLRIVYLLARVVKPAGGHAVILGHIDLLRQDGVDAAVLFADSEYPSFYESSVPSNAIDNGRAIEDREVFLIVPEADLIIWADRIIQARGDDLSRVVILNQNHFYTFNHREHRASQQIFSKALHVGTSKSIVRFLQRVLDREHVPLIPINIDHNLFRPALKIIRVAYMPRKMPEEAEFMRRVMREMYQHLTNIEWIAIDGVPTHEVAALLNHSMIFLSLARREGFGLPALEAMAAGCVVVGFSGFGGDEYATPWNGLWLQEDDLVGAAKAIGNVIEDSLTGAHYLKVMAEEARQATLTYNKENTQAALRSFVLELEQVARSDTGLSIDEQKREEAFSGQ